MKDEDHVNILVDLGLEIAFVKAEKSYIENPIFQKGGWKSTQPPNPHPCYPKGKPFQILPIRSLLKLGIPAT